jgi:hypothetical protein
MALKDLEGKRTGRPPGARTTSRLSRDAAWAYRHLDHPDARPPSPGAKLWVQFGREQPGHFLASVALLEATGRQEGGAGEDPRRDPGWAASPAQDGPRAGRLKRLFVPEARLVAYLTGGRAPWLTNLPHEFRVVGSEVDAGRRGVVLTIASEEFPEVAEGEAAPEVSPEFRCDYL